MSSMSSNKYTAGSVAQLLGTEPPTSGKVTKLQALFSRPTVQPSDLKRRKVQQLPAGSSLDAIINHSMKNRSKCGELQREAGPQEGTEFSSGHKIKHSGSRQKRLTGVSSERSATDQAANHSADGESIMQLSGKAMNAKNALTRIDSKVKAKTPKSVSRDPAQDARTVFVGNVALTTNKKALWRLFKSCGAIETLRLRSVPVADLKLPKKASIITKQFHPSRSSANAYIVFATEDAANKALNLNGTELGGLHIRVNPASSIPKHDHEKSVFIGNLPFDIEEEPVRQHFSVCGAVTNVRVVHDRKTGAGKGFGYITFVDPSSVTLALSLDKQSLCGRPLRVQRSTEKSKLPTQQKPPKKHSSLSLKSDYSQKSAKISSSAGSKPESNDVEWKKSKMRSKKKDQQQIPPTDNPVKTKTLLNHKRIKEQRKKKLRKKSEARRKQSLGQLLMKNNNSRPFESNSST